MLKAARQTRHIRAQLVTDSPLRQADPRVCLALSLLASLAIMLPMSRLLLFVAFYAVLLGWGKLLPMALRQLWRLKWALLFLFILDWLVVSLELALLVTLRMTLLAGAFAFLVNTTTPGELRLVLQWLRVPHRYAFALSLPFQSIHLLEGEWRAIQEAQQARGAWQPRQWQGWRALPGQLRELLALTVPAIVLTTRRAWALTEAAHARGFDAPHRRPYHRLHMSRSDWLLLITVTLVTAVIAIPFP
ncbi:MAG: energy-coupling factor transporter transmembrane component T [Chloroflexota bacterium]